MNIISLFAITLVSSLNTNVVLALDLIDDVVLLLIAALA